ncbi:TetR family transcriptional regulator [Tersicoccus sp. MR15.9]|uniref:TetR family transcriptional regulator n=1 Tax=Tersicoccus mangrovi TaxID=3121635 RepID=UPI002FE5DDF8
MRSARDADATDDGDLTTRARLRDAAVVRFARDGFHRTTVRAIAADAGVSPALLIHHFGSKDDLRLACDEHVLGWFVAQARAEATTEGIRTVITAFFADPDRYRVPMDYMARAIVEGTATGAHFVDTMIDETEHYVLAGMAGGTIQPVADPRAMAVFIASGSLGMLLAPDHLARNLGLEGRNPEVMRRVAGPALQLYTTGLYTDDTVQRVAEESLTAHAEDAGSGGKETGS